MQVQEKLGIDEVIDTLGDGLEIGQQLSQALADGVQITDAGVLFSVTPKILEIRKDWPTFKAQLADMDSFEADDVAAGLRQRFGNSDDKIVEKSLDGLQLAAEWYAIFEDVKDLTQRSIAFGKGLFPKKEDDPDTVAA